VATRCRVHFLKQDFMGEETASRRRPHYLKEWREARGLTLGQVARRMPYNKSSLSRIENGLQEYKEEILLGYARLCGCQPGDLINRPPGGPDELWSILGDASNDELNQILGAAKILTQNNKK
jgi:transcriptional regulator with XRE-family HTH domain